MLNFTELMNAVGGDDFAERPVDIREFVISPRYLNMGRTPLSEYQYQLIEASSQIYLEPTLISLYGEEEGRKRWKNTCNEVIAQLGKGSGKDFLSTIACSYIVYLLLCLRNPQEYYGKVDGDNIDILNIAISADQALNVFFTNFVKRIENSPWFEGRYQAKQRSIHFDKNINVYSGHSEREAWEGYNVIYVVLDEISGFALESNSGNERAATAEAIYTMYRKSVSSRFSKIGKVVLLSFPRFKNDFIQQRYTEAIKGKQDSPIHGAAETVYRTHTFQINPDLPLGTEGNEFTITWEEDHILAYAEPKVFALKRPTWEVNPLVDIDDLLRDFLTDPVDSLSRFACMPPDAVDAFFKDRDKMNTAFSGQNGIDDENRFNDWFKPRSTETKYYIHVDLAQKQDRCVVTMAHVEKWEQRRIGGKLTEPAPVVKVDVVRWWTPTSDKSVDFTDVREFILSLQRRGFNIDLVTFDRWNSHDIMNELRRAGLMSEILSVAKKHYTDMAMMVHEERLSAPNNKMFIDELLALRITKTDKIDHSRSGKKDFSDSICGAIFNAISHSPRESVGQIDVKDIESLTEELKDIEDRESEVLDYSNMFPIRAPKRTVVADEDMPSDLSSFLSGLKLIGKG